ncbi:hypothetical protein [Thermaurantimonas aggregans]|uniref:hypothetical protein n=1 Tax=Thermaurantimonas aggregans TaxID=2173829 RepID=UPI0023F593C7|nr:hypothetical protein [Thermaurantimonas aggregans]MCX8148329.1 hypothetical protein [Thermaurantimonas aggregans]
MKAQKISWLLINRFSIRTFSQNITVWLGILALMFPTFGPMSIYHFQKSKIRKEVKNQILASISLSELTVFRSSDISQHRVHWIEENEFVLNGFYYDVVKWEHTDTGSIVYCWPDHEESHLEQLRSQIASSLLNAQKHDKPSEFIGYLMFIKGFFKDAFAMCLVNYLFQESCFQFIFDLISSFISRMDHPPETL